LVFFHYLILARAMTTYEIWNSIYSEASNVFSKEIISAFIGAIIGGYFTSRATSRAHKLERSRRIEEENTTTRNTLRLIQVELNTAWEIYNQEYVSELLALPPTTPHLFTLPIGDNPFPIFDSAPLHLAHVPPAISTKIVRIYMRIKGLVKMINTNNNECEIVAEHARTEWKKGFEHARSSQLPVPTEIQNEINDIYDREMQIMARQLGMGGSADLLKIMTLELKDYVESISLDIDAFLQNENC
jgi:hypothetical protein